MLTRFEQDFNQIWLNKILTRDLNKISTRFEQDFNQIWTRF